MRKILTNVAVLALSTTFVIGCSTNTTNQNTGIGAVSGAAVGGVVAGLAHGGPAGVAVGVVAGAVVGGLIGHSMDSSDKGNMNTAMNNDANRPTTWVNTKTGKHYTVVPTSGWMTVNGNTRCRTYKATSMHHGKKHVTKGTACLDSHGVWQDTK